MSNKCFHMLLLASCIWRPRILLESFYTSNFLHSFPHCLLSVRIALLHAIPLRQSLMPRPRRRILLLPVLLKAFTHDVRSREQQPMPRHEHEVRKSALVADQVLPPSLRKMRIDHANHALDLVAVAIEARRKVLLRVIERKPGSLPVVRSLARGLEMHPAALFPFLCSRCVAQGV